MNMMTEKTVRELALENAGATRLFEKLGIDYCCGGGRTIEQACKAAHLSVDAVLEQLEAPQGSSSGQKGRNWQAEPLGDLISHIKSTHHPYVRESLTRICILLAKVCSVHGANHPELLQLRDIFEDLSEELASHLMKEEMVLFPYIVRMEEAVMEKSPILPPPFGTVQNPVAMMEHEHDSAGNACGALTQLPHLFGEKLRLACASALFSEWGPRNRQNSD